MKRLLCAVLILSLFGPASDAAAAWPSWFRKRVKEQTVKEQTNAKERSAFVSAEKKGQGRQAASPDEDVSKNPVKIGPQVDLQLKKANGKVRDLRRLSRRGPRQRERPEHEGPEPNPIVAEGSESPNVISTGVPLIPVATAPAPTPILAFDGLDREFWGAGSPPDTTGDVGPVYYIQAVNTSIGVYRKSDGFQEAAFTFDTLMSQGSFGNQCDTENFGDPVVLYDTFEDRWILTDFAFTLDGGGNINPPVAYQCFAVSQSGDPILGGWNFYSIEITDGLHDYEKLGVWTDAIYMSANMFGYTSGAGFRTARAWAINKAQMYAGAPTVQIVSFDIGGGDFTVVPSNARLQTGTPPAGRPNLFVSTWQFLNAVTVYKFHVDWNATSLSTFTGPDVPLAATSWPNAAVANAPQSGTATLLDVLQIRAMVQNQYTNLAGVESLWLPHTVRRGNTTGFAAPRWYQVDVTGGTVAANLPQAVTWDPDAANVMHRFMPSLAIDRGGNMALAYSTSSSTTFPSIKYAGRLAADPVNTFSYTEQTLFTGTASQTGSSRWGDYSSVMLDPDGCTFWIANEYANPVSQTFDKRWKTHIGAFKYPECTPVGAGGTVSGTVTATAGGAPLSGATVQLGARSTTTNGSGNYSFTSIPAGTYPTISASKPGFITGSASSIAVTDGGTTTQDFSLAAAPVSACLTDTTQADFQTGTLTSVDVTTTPGDVTLVNVAVDQQNTAGTTTGTGFGTPAWTGQTFIPSVTGQLVQAQIQLFCNGCGATPPDLTLSVRNTAAGLPTGADLASVTIPGSNFASGATVPFMATFGAPATLTAATQYALILRPVSAPAGSGYFWIRSSPSTYASGSRVLSADSGGTWSTDTTRDYNFKIVIAGPYNPPSGNVVSGNKDSNPAGGLTPIWSTLSWNGTTPASTTLQFQVAGSNNPGGPFNFIGPDGTAGTFFTTSPASMSVLYNLRYAKYKAYLATSDNLVTPALSDVTLCFNDTDCSSTVATITPTPAQVCANSTGNTASGPAGMTSYAWGIVNGTITSATNTQSITYTAGASGNVTLSLTITAPDGCIVGGSTPVTINPIPATPTISGTASFCTGGSTTLTSSSATGNQWYLAGNPIGGATNQTYDATAAGSYTVVVTENGCSSAASAATNVVVNAYPATPTIGATVNGTGTSDQACPAQPLTLTATSAGATSFQWFLGGNPIGGETNSTYAATGAGSYTVTATANTCTTAPSVAYVVQNPTPNPAFLTAGGPTTFCTGGSVMLSSNSATGIQWFLDGNPIGGATSQNYSATASGTYTALLNALGCPSGASNSIVVTVNPIPGTPTITPGGPTTFCAGGSVLLTSSSATGNQWRLNGNPIGGATNQTYSASVAGDYTVVVTTSGCSSAASSTTTVTVNPAPNATITAPASVVTLSTGNAASVANAGAGATYTWGITGGTITAGAGTNSITFTAGAVGTLALNVTVQNSAGCSDAKSANVTVTALPSVTVTSVTPNVGSSLGGTNVTIAGTGFNAGAGVTFGGSAATNVVVVNATQITAKTPAHAAGAVNVVVTNTNATSGALTNGFTYALQNFDPNADSLIDPSDIFYLVAYLFTGGPAPAGLAGMPSGDANGDGTVDPADIFHAVNYLFGGGVAPQSRKSTLATTATTEPLSGALRLGRAVQRDGQWFVPVVLTMDAGSRAPQGVSLRIAFGGAVTDAKMHRGTTQQPMFEISRRTENALSYLVAFTDETPLALDGTRSAVIAEVEVSAADAVRLDLDSELTMLVGRDMEQKATVENRGLRVSGTAIGRVASPSLSRDDQ